MRLPSTTVRWFAIPARPDGASLIDALAALTVVIIVTAGAAHVLLWSRRAAWSSGTESLAVTLAAQKLEALAALTWEAGEGGVSMSDEVTDLSEDPAQAGGSGLRPSPPATLSTNTAGFVDFVDRAGSWVGTGSRPPGGAAFVRRWSIQPFAPDPQDAVVLTVVVLPLADAAAGVVRPARGAMLTSIRTRVGR